MAETLVNQRYKIQKVIGKGASGNVHLAMDVKKNTLVAIKQCYIEDDEKSIQRLHREYQYMQQIQHKNVAKALDFFIVKNNYCIVVEYYEGPTLKKLIVEKPFSLSVEEQLAIAIQICAGVAEINRHGVVHRDLKPENIILTLPNYTPKILDLGICRQINATSQALTKTGEVVGTIPYMSPEQVNGKLSHNTDVFSLATIFYQFFLWQASSPFYSGNYVATATRIIEEKLPPLARVYPRHNEHIEKISPILEKALYKKSYLRLSSAQKFLHCLKNGTPPTSALRFFKYIALVLAIFLVMYNIDKRQADGNEDRITKSMNKIVYFIGADQHEEVIIEANKILTIDNTFVSAYSHRGFAYLEMHKNDLAQRDFEKVLQLEPQHFVAHCNLAIIYFRRKEFTLAEKKFNEALNINPQYSPAYINRSLMYAQQQRFTESLRDLNTLLMIDKNNAMAYTNRGCAYAQLQKYRLALQDFNKAILVNPKYSDAYKNRANLYVKIQKFDLATKDYTTAIKIDSQNVDVYLNRAKAYLIQKKYTRANKDINRYLYHAPRSAEGYFLKARLYRIQDKFSVAEQHYTQAIEIDKNYADAYVERGSVRAAQQKYALAEQDFATALSRKPQFFFAYMNRGNLYLAQEKYLQAEKDFANAKAIRPQNPHPYIQLADMYMATKHYKKALQNYELAIKMNPKMLYAHARLGSCYFQQQKYLLAIRSWEESIKLGAKSSEISPFIKEAQKRLQQKEKK
ncbi:serine/threonine-protein kinase [Candidatus Uabimicrobium amorphum]|uniref:Protein kinase domain-containing protein n=1 Tax=Uabimicrobium amorphum TaxID=2596890 RepID=A0A5S9IR78_UABAM|nr:serine/threonine-protein kinase [Candidatus Uabimicrobium amorphum]BBM86414.1 hypothetical protein UABAM_04800 [Candidatus Uabimicrobium amorphum]